MNVFFQLFISLSLLLLLASCGEESPRKYQEKASPSTQGMDGCEVDHGGGDPHAQGGPMAEMVAGGVRAENPYSWTTPEGWQDQGSKSALRLASFAIEGEAELSCGIIRLDGNGGGLDANVKMWASQIGIELSDEQATAFLSKQAEFKTSGDIQGRYVDYTSLVTEDTGKCVFLAVLPIEGRTLFLKMTGPKSSILKQIEKAKSLCSSIAVK
ncbi:MAG: hypothetical protein HQL31_12350 [Planctomycetes bacterium]|nr:hypothetical protein [Planctomycetota bacterium]